MVFTGEFRKPTTAQDVTDVMRAAVSSGLVVGVTVDINSIMNEGKTEISTCKNNLKIVSRKYLTLNAPISTKVVCLFSSAEMFKKPLWQTVWTQIRLLL